MENVAEVRDSKLQTEDSNLIQEVKAIRVCLYCILAVVSMIFGHLLAK